MHNICALVAYVLWFVRRLITHFSFIAQYNDNTDNANFGKERNVGLYLYLQPLIGKGLAWFYCRSGSALYLSVFSNSDIISIPNTNVQVRSTDPLVVHS